ncbi:PIN domain-containing protein [Aquincola sp. S2]|uniref:PIN domain-containing protein n=1 Tax=Pseudaquabacterium terrae TaxID=2732868 RepID=A0ABX2EJ47_9BURK|nr:PIN domain-containing protein [Aquabacterium terrae]
MIVALDTKCLVCWSRLDPDDPDRQRFEFLLTRVAAVKGRVVIPTPVVAEFLVGADAGSADWLTTLDRKAAVQVAPFDRRAAMECAQIDRELIRKGDKRGGRKDAWQRIKIDRQVVAIAKVAGATMIISDDAGLCQTAKSLGMQATSVSDLPLPDSARQWKLDLQEGATNAAAQAAAGAEGGEPLAASPAAASLPPSTLGGVE